MLPLNQLVQQECVYFPDFLNRPANWIAAQTMKKFEDEAQTRYIF